MIRRIALAGLCLALLYSCDNRNDYFEDYNQAPTLKLFKNSAQISTSTYSDSVKIGVDFPLDYILEDEERLNVQTACVSGSVSASVQESKIVVDGTSEGLSLLRIFAKDSYGKTAQYDLELTVFRNLAPVAAMDISRVNADSHYEYQLDASKSYDRDSRFGGHIVLYEYTFGTYTFTSTLDKVRYVFGTGGQKKLGVRVKDNSGDYSSLVSEYVVLE